MELIVVALGLVLFASIFVVILLIPGVKVKRWGFNGEISTLRIKQLRGNSGTGSTKTKKSERTIKVDDIVIQQLKSYRIANKALLLKHGRKLQEDITKDDSFIFISPHTIEPFFPRV